MIGGPPSCAPLGGFAASAWVSLLWQHMRLMRNVIEDASTRCIAVSVMGFSQVEDLALNQEGKL